MIEINKLVSYIDSLQDELCNLSKKIWDYSELSFSETNSSKLLADKLESNGFTVERGIGGLPTAFSANYGFGKPVIALLGEYDALPELSQKAACCKKTPNGNKSAGHGCGHNALGVGSYAAAVAAKRYMEEYKLPGTIRFYGCPAEENGAGKMQMAVAGVFDDVDAALAWHPDTKTGVMTMGQLANQCIVFKFSGVSAHAAVAPELGRSALDACELMNVGVNYLREHITSDARLHYAYLDVGGDAPNVVQSHAALKYFIRAPKLHEMLSISKRVRSIARGAALMTETKLEIQPQFGMCDFVSNETIGKLMDKALSEVGGPQFGADDEALAKCFFDQYQEEQINNDIRDLACYTGDKDEANKYSTTPLIKSIFKYRKSDGYKMGSSDVGDVSYKAPTAWLSVAGCAFGTPFHTWYATAQAGSGIMDKAMLCAAKTLALTALYLFKSPSVLTEAKREHLKATGGKYISPMSE